MNKTKTTNVYLENAIKYKEKFGLDFIPLRITKNKKKPNVDKWKYLQVTEQTIDDLKGLNWNRSNGIGMINKKIFTIDFDKCSDVQYIRKIMDELGGKYWLVKTGFGYHLHFRIEEIEYLESRLGKNGTIYLYPIDKSVLEHIELRIKDCYTAFPSSRHNSGAKYIFIDGEPEQLPDFVVAKKLLDVLRKYFNVSKIELGETDNKIEDDELSKLFAEGVDEGTRQNCLKKLFGILHSRDIKRNMLETMLKEWNAKNRPPLNKKEFDYQFNDLIRRYDKGLDGIFLQFNNCLLQLKDDYKIKIEKIICFGVVEYDGDKKIIKELGLEKQLAKYHQECKSLVEHYENWTGRKDQIVRVGKTLILDVYYKRFRFEYFCIYIGIISYLGRNKNKPAKQISQSIIGFRAMGFKDEAEYLLSASDTIPIKGSTIRSGIRKIEDMNLVRSFSLVKGRMKWFSTFIETNEKLAQLVKNYEIKKMHKRSSNDLLRSRIEAEIKIEQEKLNELINNKQKIACTSSSYPPSSHHLLSNES